MAAGVDDELEDGDGAVKDRVLAAVGENGLDASGFDRLEDVSADAENRRRFWR